MNGITLAEYATTLLESCACSGHADATLSDVSFFTSTGLASSPGTLVVLGRWPNGVA